jgi:hypothetical protein
MLLARLVGRIALGAMLGVCSGAASPCWVNASPRSVPYPPLRNAQQKPTWLGGGTGPSAAEAGSPGLLRSPGSAGSAGSPVGSGAVASSGPLLPDAKWCGIETLSPPPESATPCKLTTLPCGPVGAERIHNNSGEETDDLDGDGQRDLVIGGRITVSAKEVFAAIYRGTESGYVLSDYRVVPARAEPTFASTLLVESGKAPVLRDGHDLVESSGKSQSSARLRRYDGQRFRTLMSFCAHRSEPSTWAPTGVRQGQNRVDFIDVDKDGGKEVVIQGLLAPLVFRFSENGLMLIEDRQLTQKFRETSHEIVRARSLRVEAERLIDSGEVRRAAELYQRAFLSAPYDIDLGLAAAEAQVRSGQPDRALEMVSRLRFQDPERGSIACTMAAVQRALKNPSAEQASLRLCADRDSDEARRRQAQSRLRELSGQPGAATPPPVAAPSNAQTILEEGLGAP